MPIKIPNDLPAFQTLENENIFVIPDDRAAHQDIRALKIAIVNLMPDKIATETQLLRLLSNTPLHVDIDLIQMSSHMSKKHLFGSICSLSTRTLTRFVIIVMMVL